MIFISEHFSILLTVVTVITVVVNVFNWWYISKGKMYIAYKLSCVVYLGYILVETMLAFRNPEQISILLFNIINMWALAMAVRGLVRLKIQKREEVQNS